MTRNEEISSLRKKGYTLQEIGSRFSISRERVRQLTSAAYLSKNRPKKWYTASQSFRRTCYICRVRLTEPTRFCEKCIKENKLNVGGKELPRGIVRGRDNNTCQVCGYKWKGWEKKRLDVHHLEGLCGKHTRDYDRPEMLFKMITVCHKCHYNLHDHSKYGEKHET